MYSGSFHETALGVVGVSEPASRGGYSNAVEKLSFVIAVSGIGDWTTGSEADEIWLVAEAAKGLWTSRATLITTSNLEASSAVGSRYRYTLSLYIAIGPSG